MVVGLENDAVVDLWWTSIEGNARAIGAAVDGLDDGERRRADRFTVEAGRMRFIAAHAMLRLLISRDLGVGPAELRFADGPRGKPSLAEPAVHPAPRFNISHSGDLAVVVLADSEVGVDVEMIRPVPNLERLALRFFSEAERQRLAADAGLDREATFLAMWTGKEAYLKAVGSGVAMPLRAVEIDPGGPAIERLAGDPHAAGEWTLLRPALTGPAVCTVAVRGHGWRSRVREFAWEA